MAAAMTEEEKAADEANLAKFLRVPDIAGEALQCIMKLRKLSQQGISSVADVLAGLNEAGRVSLVVKVVDAALEELERALESERYRDPQKQLAT